MLFLNKQRLIAIEELQKVERDREYLMAKVAQVEAEYNATIAMRETLEQKLKAAEAALEMAQLKGGRSRTGPNCIAWEVSFLVSFLTLGFFSDMLQDSLLLQ